MDRTRDATAPASRATAPGRLGVKSTAGSLTRWRSVRAAAGRAGRPTRHRKPGRIGSAGPLICPVVPRSGPVLVGVPSCLALLRSIVLRFTLDLSSPCRGSLPWGAAEQRERPQGAPRAPGREVVKEGDATAARAARHVEAPQGAGARHQRRARHQLAAGAPDASHDRGAGGQAAPRARLTVAAIPISTARNSGGVTIRAVLHMDSTETALGCFPHRNDGSTHATA